MTIHTIQTRRGGSVIAQVEKHCVTAEVLNPAGSCARAFVEMDLHQCDAVIFALEQCRELLAIKLQRLELEAA